MAQTAPRTGAIRILLLSYVAPLTLNNDVINYDSGSIVAEGRHGQEPDHLRRGPLELDVAGRSGVVIRLGPALSVTLADVSLSSLESADFKFG